MIAVSAPALLNLEVEELGLTDKFLVKVLLVNLSGIWCHSSLEKFRLLMGEFAIFHIV